MPTNAPQAAAVWSSRFTFLLASVGAAVGLGNFWKFPYITGVNGGGAFVLVYIAAAAFVAIPILIAEMAIGRRGRHSPARAMAAVAAESNRSSAWRFVGGAGVLVGFLIVTFYAVIAGWAMAYVWPTFAGTFTGIDATRSGEHFSALLASPAVLAFWSAAFLALNALISARGLNAGVERAINFLMPALFAALIIVIGYAALAGDFAAAFSFLFTPDFSKINGQVVLAAIGQAFFSIGVGMGIMMVYGSYLPKDVSLTRSGFLIAFADTLVAVLAGLAIFPLVFANGLDPGEGAGLIFVTLPIAFGNMPAGAVFGGMFFLLLVVAALTSSIALIEAVLAWLGERYGWSRRRAAWSVCAAAWVLSLATVFSFNLWADVRPLGMFERFAGMTAFDLIDYATSNVMMPAVALLIAVFVGWSMRRDLAADELGLGTGFHFNVWRNLLIRWVAPLAIVGILIANL
ncbi:MAG TPA: sodium-dependent transporter [Steroidobacteraceae bacterium]|nr:sodium-dependent transporter [Steroidobacteraceae bacterium]